MTIREHYIQQIATGRMTPAQAYREIQKELEWNAEDEHLFRRGQFEEYIEASNFLAHYIAAIYIDEHGNT